MTPKENVDRLLIQIPGLQTVDEDTARKAALEHHTVASCPILRPTPAGYILWVHIFDARHPLHWDTPHEELMLYLKQADGHAEVLRGAQTRKLVTSEEVWQPADLTRDNMIALMRSARAIYRA